ncbi:hypothetical protein [Naasia aerilata]|uniref:hypothetical protein n=1 Tax=Naasia aerilata TaxID=1162966 RepID=UPI002573E839|nr:hypothetical protein [Naasia aerilata]
MAAALGLLLAAFGTPVGADPVVVIAVAGLVLLTALAVLALAGFVLAGPTVAGRPAGGLLQHGSPVLPSSRPSSRPRPRAPSSGVLAG